MRHTTVVQATCNEVQQSPGTIIKCLKYKTTFKCENEQKEAFDTIIHHIMEDLTIRICDITEPLMPTSCLWKWHWGGLRQKYGIIEFFSGGLSTSEKNYSIVEKEFPSIVKSLQHFRKIILGCQTIIFTDNKNLNNTLKDCIRLSTHYIYKQFESFIP